jgi:heme/copper-type cytochrome/quinol oxidase subunit 3
VSVHVLRPVRVVAGSRRTPLVAPAAMAMLIFVFTEVMLFAGLISAFTIVRSSALAWPPPNQPRLPIEETAVNTLALMASGVLLFVANRLFRRDPARARWPLLISMLLGACFVLFQGVEWMALLRQGLTVTSSLLGSFFYLIVGLHGLHAAVALGVLATAWNRLRQEGLSPALFAAAQIFWYFVVGVWPVLYLRVYLA